jgi:transposase InsO family protein
MSRANPLWGAPRIHGELVKLGIDLSQTTVAKYMIRHPRPSSPSWRAFLDNHLKSLVSIDFFTVPTVRFRILFVFLVLSLDRRRIVHFNVNEHPSAEWAGRQLVEAFPWDTVPRYLIRDRDGIYGQDFTRCVNALGIKQVLIAPRSPWQNPYVERVIGSIRRECLDHVVVFSENHLRRVLRSYLRYYHVSRTHLALGKDAPEPREVQPPGLGKVVAFPEVGGLHHRYSRAAA